MSYDENDNLLVKEYQMCEFRNGFIIIIIIEEFKLIVYTVYRHLGDSTIKS